jgi:hypothetical protein
MTLIGLPISSAAHFVFFKVPPILDRVARLFSILRVTFRLPTDRTLDTSVVVVVDFLSKRQDKR